MSKIEEKLLLCRACGLPIEAPSYESVNPQRDPPLRAELLARTLTVMACPRCGRPHQHFFRFVWADIPGGLCALVAHEEERPGWHVLEVEARQTFAAPFAEGPPIVRAWGERMVVRLCLGLEELREKVIARAADADDRLLEALKLEAGGALTLEEVAGDTLRLVDNERTLELPRAALAEAAGRREALAASYPGLFAPDAAWISWRRAGELPDVV